MQPDGFEVQVVVGGRAIVAGAVADENGELSPQQQRQHRLAVRIDVAVAIAGLVALVLHWVVHCLLPVPERGFYARRHGAVRIGIGGIESHFGQLAAQRAATQVYGPAQQARHGGQMGGHAAAF